MLRVDNGAPWGSWSDLPPVLALWLIGLGVEMHWNDPKRPQQNGVIERSQGLAKTWGEPGQCQTVRKFQHRINREDRLQREVYPAIDDLPRMTAYPELKHSGRRYSISWEQRHWNWELVLAHLSGYAVQRKVDRAGNVSFYSGRLYVGKLHKGCPVYVQFDPDRIEWVVSDTSGNQLRAVPAQEINPRAVRALKLKPLYPK
jgi:hypothetical protein